MSLLEPFILDLDEMLADYCTEHKIDQVDGPPTRLDHKLTPYSTIHNGVETPEGSAPLWLWGEVCQEMQIEFFENLTKWMNGRKSIVWRRRPEIIQTREIYEIKTVGGPMLKSISRDCYIYCRLTAY